MKDEFRWYRSYCNTNVCSHSLPWSLQGHQCPSMEALVPLLRVVLVPAEKKEKGRLIKPEEAKNKPITVCLKIHLPSSTTTFGR